MRLKVTIVAGLHADVAAEVTSRMLRSPSARTAVLEHDITDLARGRVLRTVRDAVGSQHLVVDLSHGCVGCTLRESVVPALAECARHGRYDHVVLALPPAVEPQPVAHALVAGTFGATATAAFVDLHAVVTAVAPERVVRDADSDEWLADRGMACGPEDSRFVAEVLVRQIEHADVLVAPPVPGTGLELLAHLNPGAPMLPLRRCGTVLCGQRRHDALAAAFRSQPGVAPATLRTTDGRVSSLVWRAARPLHPQRLHSALGGVVPAVLRTRGHVCLATQPHIRHAFSTTGPRFELSPTARWLVANGDIRNPGDHAAGPLDMERVLGNSENELVLTGLDLDGGALHDLLDSAMLNAVEIAAGPEHWRTLPDPFAPPRHAAPLREPRPSGLSLRC